VGLSLQLARMEEMKNTQTSSVRKSRGKDHLEYIGVDRMGVTGIGFGDCR
jgi:hypothetical protein